MVKNSKDGVNVENTESKSYYKASLLEIFNFENIRNALVLKTDSIGNILWKRAYGLQSTNVSYEIIFVIIFISLRGHEFLQKVFGLQ